jgi:putative ABC transport system permease protein
MIGAQLLGQARRMLVRDWRSGELRLLALALAIAVAAVTSVGFFVDRVRLGLQRDAAQTMGGDAVLESDHPIDPHWFGEAQRAGLRSAQTVSFPSMALAAGTDGADVSGNAGAGSGAGPGASQANDAATLLVAVKAVTDTYPLRGALQVLERGVARTAAGVPRPGSAWVEAGVLAPLGLHVGDMLILGKRHLRIDAVIASEPDRLVQIMGFAPRVLINIDDLPSTGLIQPASRASYRWLIAGDAAAVRALSAQLAGQLARGQHLESLEDGQPQTQRTVDRTERFLGLVALLTVLVAAVAASSAARRFSTRRLDACALMRCLGISQRRITALFSIEFLAIGVLAGCAGTIVGLGLHLVLMRLLGAMLPSDVPLPGVYPAVQGFLCGLVLILGFALPPLEQLRRVSPVRVLRHDLGAPGARSLLAYLLGAAGFAVLLVWTAGEIRLGAIVGAGFVACVAVFAGVALGMLRALRWLRGAGAGSGAAASGRPAAAALGVAWRFALAAVQRRPGATVAQLVALAIGLMALLLLAIVRTDLIDQWRGQAPADAPNRFIINIQPEQRDEVIARLQAAHIEAAVLEPMIRGRLIAVDGVPIGPDSFDDERARGLVEREFNLSYRNEPPPYDPIVHGTWFAPDAAELSIEAGIAKRLHIALGQRLRFDVAGQMVEATVTSVRKVDWNSMHVNFFVIMSPGLLRDAPQSFITSFYLPPGQADVAGELVRRFPNLTVIDIGRVLAQVRGMLDQVIAAVQFLFVFSLAAGVLVLYTALIASQDERVREAALLRALGASRRQLANAQTAEMVLVGSLAGVLAALGAAAIAWALAHYAFEFDFVPRAWILLAGLLAGNAAALAGGQVGMRRVLHTPPLLSLRNA